MKAIKINLGGRSYQILVGYGMISSAGACIKKLKLGQDAYVITNSFIKKRYGRLLEESLKKSGFGVRFKTVPDSEKSKSIGVFSRIIKDAASHDKGKRIFIIAFGGGVIGDLSGFIASVYKRGIPYIQIPTTLLAQVDSSIGGKTGIDLTQGKNLVGAFYQPRLVLSDVKLLRTLDKRQVSSGLAEIIKYAAIKDEGLFNYLEDNLSDILSLKQKALEFCVTCCVKIKAGIVGLDEKEEKGIRTILNFGHTVGHAIEAAANYGPYMHGEAIALGMLAATDISRSLRLIDEGSAARIEKLIKSAGLPTRIKGVSLSKIINAHYRDKKFIGSRNRFVLIRNIGTAKIAVNIPLKIIEECLKKRLS